MLTHAVGALFIGLMISACSPHAPSSLAAVQASGKLVVVTHGGPTTYYEGPQGPEGFEYDLLKGFADSLQVKLVVLAPERFSDIVPMLVEHKAQIAAGLAMTSEREQAMRFGPGYQRVRQQVIYRLGSQPPKDVADLAGRQVEVVRGSSEAEHLRTLQQTQPGLRWTEADNASREDLLRMVWAGLLDLTVADSNLVEIARQYYPELRVAFSLDEPRTLAWAFAADSDDSLSKVAALYLKKLKDSGALAHLVERYYGPASRFDYINLAVYQAHVRTRLPLYQPLFAEAGEQYHLDWRLLAAVGYQESYWDPRAVSPTGVRGLMMLTSLTAEHLGINDRIDPEQSIDGGARYLRSLIDHVAPGVPRPDRIWMALAAYNVGIYHLEDARQITRKRGGNLNSWSDVKQSLPLLSRPSWYKGTLYGFARGDEAVRFVSRVRTYYDVLVKADQRQQRLQTRPNMLDVRAPAI